MGTPAPPGDTAVETARAALGLGSLSHLLRDLVAVVELASGRVMLANPAAESLLGWPADEMVGRPFEDFLPASSRPALRDMWQRARDTGVLQLVSAGRPMEMLLLTRAGETRNVDVTASLTEVQGHTFVVAVCHDVSGRQQVQQALAESETRFRALAETDPVAIAVLDLAGQLLYLNPAGARLCSVPDAAAVIGQPFEMLVEESERHRVQAIMDAADGVGAGETIELHVNAPGATVARVATRGAPLRNATGQRAGTIVVAWDVTGQEDRERRRTALFRAARRFALETDPEQLLQVVLEETVAALDGTYAVVRLWDAAAGGLVVRASTLPPGAPLDIVQPGEGVTGEAWLNQQPVAHYPPHQSGARAGVTGALSVPLLHEGQPLGTLAVATVYFGRRFTPSDIGVLTVLADLATAALVGLENARLHGAILAVRTAQHQVNNHLGLTVGYSELLAYDADLPPHLRGVALEALESAQQAAAMLRELRDLTHIEAWQVRDPEGAAGAAGVAQLAYPT